MGTKAGAVKGALEIRPKGRFSPRPSGSTGSDPAVLVRVDRADLESLEGAQVRPMSSSAFMAPGSGAAFAAAEEAKQSGLPKGHPVPGDPRGAGSILLDVRMVERSGLGILREPFL
jgi:hypothetical protein